MVKVNEDYVMDRCQSLREPQERKMTDKDKQGYKRGWRKAKRTGEKKTENILHFIFKGHLY